MLRNSRPFRGFTLIELLIVISVLAILAITVVLILNPAEIFKKGRDGTRLSDLATIQKGLLVASEQGSASFSMGSSSVTYVSIPDPAATTTAGSDCSGLGGYFTGGGSFHCAASSTYRKNDGTGWIPVNLSNLSISPPLTSLPVDPVNTTSSNEYYAYQTDGTTFKLTAFPESQTYLNQAGADSNTFVTGNNRLLSGGYWVLVPGNSQYGTKNFWVMKYDAACSDGSGNLLNDHSNGAGGYDNTALGCSSANGRQPAALPGGWPIVRISHTTAKSYCAAIGAHLLTNDEYMTIAMNAAGVGSNWTSGSVGTGCLMTGHSSGAPIDILPPDANDANGYAGEGDTTYNCTGDQRRTVTLSNGSVVWDIAGNVSQNVQRSTNNVGDATAAMNLPACSGGGALFGACQFSSVTSWTSDISQAAVAPPNLAWGSSQSAGSVYTYLNGGSSQGTTIIYRGGQYGALNGTTTGLFAIGLDKLVATTDNGIGFRCAR